VTSRESGPSIGLELLNAGTNLLASAIVFSAVWLSTKRLRISPISHETLVDLALSVLLYLPLTFLVAYCVWRVVLSFVRRFRHRAAVTRFDPWIPGAVLGAVLGLLDAYAGLLGLWTPLFRRLTG
jgi:hypothetical protein